MLVNKIIYNIYILKTKFKNTCLVILETKEIPDLYFSIQTWFENYKWNINCHCAIGAVYILNVIYKWV